MDHGGMERMQSRAGSRGSSTRFMSFDAFSTAPSTVTKRSQSSMQDGDGAGHRSHTIGTEELHPLEPYDVTWTRDEEVDCCMVCHSAFGFLNRRHHCRSCGDVVCSSCSPARREVFGLLGLQRVCEECMNNGVWFDPHPQRIAAAKAAANASTAAKDGNSEGSDAASESTTLLEEEEREHDEIERYRTLVTAFYKQHAPLKVAQVDKLLKKYSNDLKHMYRVLHLKYNVPFPGEEGARAPAIVRRPTGMPRPPRSTRSTSTHSQSSSRCDEACPSPAVATSGIASTKVMTPVTSPTSSTDTLAVDSEAHVDTSSTAAEMVEAVTVAVKKVSFSEPQAEPTTEEASLPLEAAVAAPAADVPTAPEQTESPMLNKMHEKPGSIPPCCCTIS